jgi:hypothetical protein
LEATKLFFFKEFLHKTKYAMDNAFSSRKGRIHIVIFSAWLAKVFLPSSFELQNHHDTILRRKEAEAATAEGLAIQKETHNNNITQFPPIRPSPPPANTSHVLQYLKPTKETKHQTKKELGTQTHKTSSQ